MATLSQILGQTASTIGSLMNTGIPQLTAATSNPTTTGLPRGLEQLGGAAALITGLTDKPTVNIPDFGTFASPAGNSSSGYLQGIYGAPDDPMATGGILSGYEPLLAQQEKTLLDDAQQRIIAGLPASMGTAMGGSEIGAIRSAISNELLPRRQALIADLTRENLNRKINAATTVLGFEKAAQLYGFQAALQAAQSSAEAERNRNAQLAQLGIALLLGGNQAQGTALLQQAQAGAAGSQGGGLGNALGSFLGGNSGMGQYAPIGQMSVTDIIGQMQAGTLSTSEGMALLSKSLPGVVGAGTAGYGVGRQVGGAIGSRTDSQALGGLSGAASGAAAGAAIGSIVPGVGTAIGAIVGGLAGLFGGFGATQNSQQAQKEAFRREDLDSQADQVQEIGSFFNQRLAALGVDTVPFQQYVSQMITASSGPGDEQREVATRGGQLLLAAIQRTRPEITALSQVPGLRDEFIDYLTRSTTTSSNSAYGGGPALNYIGSPNPGPGGPVTPWYTYAGLADGGQLPAGGEFIVGERGPELMRAAPGTQILPMRRDLNGAYAFDVGALRRNILPPNIFLPNVNRAIETTPAAALLGRMPQLTALSHLAPTLTSALDPLLAGIPPMANAPGGAPLPGAIRPPARPLPIQARASNTATRSTKPAGQRTLTQALSRRPRRRTNAPAYT